MPSTCSISHGKRRQDYSERYEETKALAADADELAVESLVDAVLESQLHEVEEARTLYRRCASALRDGSGLMTVDMHLAEDQLGG